MQGSHANGLGEASSGYAWWSQDRARCPPGFLTRRKRVGQARSPDAAMTSALPGPAWKGFRARHQVASMASGGIAGACFECLLYTGGAAPRGAGGRGLKGSGEHQKRLGVRRTDWLVLLGCLADGACVLGRQGDTGTSPGLGGLSKLSAVPRFAGPGTQGDG